jgi:hypothetical protein
MVWIWIWIVIWIMNLDCDLDYESGLCCFDVNLHRVMGAVSLCLAIKYINILEKPSEKVNQV